METNRGKANTADVSAKNAIIRKIQTSDLRRSLAADIIQNSEVKFSRIHYASAGIARAKEKNFYFIIL